jgi:hypothetical protein
VNGKGKELEGGLSGEGGGGAGGGGGGGGGVEGGRGNSLKEEILSELERRVSLSCSFCQVAHHKRTSHFELTINYFCTWHQATYKKCQGIPEQGT